MAILTIYILNSLVAFLAAWLAVQSGCTLYKLARIPINKKIFVYLEGYIVVGAWAFFESVRYYRLIGDLYPPSDISWNIIIIMLLYLALSNVRFYKEMYPQASPCVITKALRKLQNVLAI
jgi:hypothetical protein